MSSETNLHLYIFIESKPCFFLQTRRYGWPCLSLFFSLSVKLFLMMPSFQKFSFFAFFFVCFVFCIPFLSEIRPATFNCYTGKMSPVCLKDINPVQDTCWNRRNVTSDNLQRITANTHSKPPGNKWCWPRTLQLLPQSPQSVCAVQPPNCKKHHAIKKNLIM